MVTFKTFSTVFFVLVLMLGMIIAAIFVRWFDRPADPRLARHDEPRVHAPQNGFEAIYPLPISIFDPRWEGVLIDETPDGSASLPPATGGVTSAVDSAFGVCGPSLPCVP